MSTRIIEISSSDDIIDVRDIIARVEELEADTASAFDGDDEGDPEREELDRLTALLDDLKGNGDDEDWRGDWYPVTLICESYFPQYAEELANDIGAVDSDAGWPTNRIDWEAAANDLLIDYTSTEFEGVTYYYR